MKFNMGAKPMRKRILPVLLAIALLISLVGCGGSSGVDDAPSSSNIESQIPSETPEETPSMMPTQAPSQSEEPAEVTQEPIASELPEETIAPTIEPTEQAAPTSTPASSAPVSTSAPTSTPTPTTTPEPHTHSYSVVQAATCTVDGIKKCSCGDTITIPANGHTYINQTIPEAGHYEQVQVGVETVVVGREQYWIIECRACHAHFYNTDDLNWHQDPNNPDALVRCWDVGSDYYSRHRDITEQQPIYEDKWIVDTPESQIQVCSVCGQQQ